MVCETRKQSMAWMETDYSNHMHWKIKWRLEHLGALWIMGETTPLTSSFWSVYDLSFVFLRLPSSSFVFLRLHSSSFVSLCRVEPCCRPSSTRRSLNKQDSWTPAGFIPPTEVLLHGRSNLCMFMTSLKGSWHVKYVFSRDSLALSEEVHISAGHPWEKNLMKKTVWGE